MQLSGKLGKTVKKIKKEFCPCCKNMTGKKECPLLEMCTISIFSLNKKKPLHFVKT